MSIKKFETEYIKKNFKEWKEKYNIPDFEDFNLKTLFHLQEQFINTPDDHVKTKCDILRMINDIKSRWHSKYFEEKDIYPKRSGIRPTCPDCKQQMFKTWESSNENRTGYAVWMCGCSASKKID